MKPLTLKEIIKKHKQSLPLLRKGKQNPKDIDLHKDIETKEVRKEAFNKLIHQSIKQEPFDKKK